MAATLTSAANSTIGRLAQINVGAGGISLHSYTKAYIQVVEDGIPRKLYCQFNPASVTISKSVSWEASGGESEGGSDAYFEKGPDGKITYHPADSGSQPNKNAPKLEFKGGESATFSLDLLFDTTDKQPGTLDRDVRRYTNDLLGLTLGAPKSGNNLAEGEVEAPKPVRFGWGDFELFEAVITDVEISFIMFDPDGKPVRATAAVGFMEWVSDKANQPQNPTTRTEPRKTWIVQHGQTLHQIAYAEYGHPGHWRHIADSNNLLNPLKLQPGQILVLPPID